MGSHPFCLLRTRWRRFISSVESPAVSLCSPESLGLPHREPFVFVDEVTDREQHAISLGLSFEQFDRQIPVAMQCPTHNHVIDDDLVKEDVLLKGRMNQKETPIP
jgi:hypothetical protein